MSSGGFMTTHFKFSTNNKKQKPNNMKHKLKKTDNYLLVVDESEIKEGDWFYDLDTKYLKIKQSWENSHLIFNSKKIIAHLSFNGVPILEGVPLLPPIEDEVEKLAKEEILYNDQKRAWWKQGYNKAKEKYNKAKYPVAFECEMVDKGEEDWIGDDITGEPFWNEKLEPKTITNSQGQTQLVGTYIYE
jgi:hypothetical protein